MRKRLIVACGVLALLTSPRPLVAQGENAMQFASVEFAGSCGDGLNSRVFLANRHQSRDIMATVRWRVANGQFSTQQFRINAGMRQQIGCAADASIQAARFLNAGEVATSFVTIMAGERCDQLNRQIFATNRHSSRDIIMTVRWRVAGGDYATHQFRVNAGVRTQIGCATDARIVAASFLNQNQDHLPL